MLTFLCFSRGNLILVQFNHIRDGCVFKRRYCGKYCKNFQVPGKYYNDEKVNII